MRWWAGCMLLICLLASCHDRAPETLFKRVPSAVSGIRFANTITENDTIHILAIEYLYNGGGVAVGDFNNDGLSDVFFTGNQVSNRLYLNRGKLVFEDVTLTAGLYANVSWHTGVALVDINQDGWLDIYVCAAIHKDSADRGNKLYVHQGLNPDGIPVFKEQAAVYGIADRGHSHMAAFFDYDRDGDLDLYVLSYTLDKEIPLVYRTKVNDGSSPTNDQLYQNNGDGTFSNVTQAAGILCEGYGLGLAITDINRDGWPDIYVSNDYMTNDLLYMNNHDGTFTNQIRERIKHQSEFSMGNDVGDINNDGLPDIITLDMLPEGNLRKKTTIAGPTYTRYLNNEKYGYQYQYMRNMLQLNNGDGTFSEIGQLAGIYQTEWSWSPLLADVDNDGYKDLLITNGFPKDVTDRDFGNYRSGTAGRISNLSMLLDSIPVVKVSNYAFHNNGDLTFTNVTNAWGLQVPTFSNGAAYADLDNDGDLDYIVNNLNEEAFLYENRLYNEDERIMPTNFLRIQLVGNAGNRHGLGARLAVYYNHGQIQYAEHSVYRGYLSTVEPVVHMGLGFSFQADSLQIIWPDGAIEWQYNIPAGNLTLRQAAAHKPPPPVAELPVQPCFTDARTATQIQYVHQEDDKVDFNVQRTLAHKFTQFGPGAAVGDVNGDGRDDVYITGAAGKASVFYIQRRDGTFYKRIQPATGAEALGALFFDADQDGDQDLYVVNGSYEWEAGDAHYQDVLYKNYGGWFAADAEALPAMSVSGACVRAADFDADGDLDLFVGGRVVPWQFPITPESMILENQGGRFTNVTARVAPQLTQVGMVTDALWSDFNNDGAVDLMVVGEYMPITFFMNTGGHLERQDTTGLAHLKGRWNSLIGGDFDHDGDTDYIVGNIGLNNYYHTSPGQPVKVFARDFDDNGSIDPIIACYIKVEDGSMQLCPAHFWDDMMVLSPRFRKQFSRYKEYGRVTMAELLSAEDLADCLVLETNYAASSYVENLGHGSFRMQALPTPAQFAPVLGMVPTDVNGDGHLDVVMIGNDYGNEIFAGRYDAFNGEILLGNGAGHFRVTQEPSGFTVRGDAKALVQLFVPHQSLILATQNRDSLCVFKQPLTNTLFTPQPDDCAIVFAWPDGTQQKTELYYGAGYLSQSSRTCLIPTGIQSMVVIDYKNNKRKVPVSAQ